MSATPQTVLITGHITPADKLASNYFYVPVDVPDDIVRLQVRYDYSHQRDAADQVGLVNGNTLDIGIFDPRGHEFVSISGDLDGPRIELKVQQGQSHYHMGEVVTDTSEPITMRWRVVGAAGCILRLVVDGIVIQDLAINDANWQSQRANLTHPTHFIRAEVIQKTEST